MKLKNIMIACLCAPLLASVATAQDKASEDDKAFKDLFNEWAEFSPVDDNEWLPVITGASGAIFMIRAKDLNNSTDKSPKVWIKTDHSKNKTVEYRTMMALISFDCTADKYTTLSQTAHMPDGSIGHRWKGYETNYIVPETAAEAWAAAVCPAQS